MREPIPACDNCCPAARYNLFIHRWPIGLPHRLANRVSFDPAPLSVEASGIGNLPAMKTHHRPKACKESHLCLICSKHDLLPKLIRRPAGFQCDVEPAKKAHFLLFIHPESVLHSLILLSCAAGRKVASSGVDFQ